LVAYDPTLLDVPGSVSGGVVPGSYLDFSYEGSRVRIRLEGTAAFLTNPDTGELEPQIVQLYGNSARVSVATITNFSIINDGPLVEDVYGAKPEGFTIYEPPRFFVSAAIDTRYTSKRNIAEQIDLANQRNSSGVYGYYTRCPGSAAQCYAIGGMFDHSELQDVKFLWYVEL
jgi:hypothetical protein